MLCNLVLEGFLQFRFLAELLLIIFHRMATKLRLAFSLMKPANLGCVRPLSTSAPAAENAKLQDKKSDKGILFH